MGPRDSFTLHWMLCVGSGLAYAAAFPPFAVWPLAWVALAPFFAVAARSTVSAALGWGVRWGLSTSVAVAGWLPGMLSGYFGVDPVLAWAGSAAIAAVLMGVPYGLFAGWVAWLAERGRAHPLVVAAGLCALEIDGPGGAPVRLACGVGVATGETFVGSIRAVDRQIWSAIGNTVNLAARLEAKTRDLGALVVVDEATWRGCGDVGSAFERLDRVSIKGRSEEFTIYALPLAAP